MKSDGQSAHCEFCDREPLLRASTVVADGVETVLVCGQCFVGTVVRTIVERRSQVGAVRPLGLPLDG